MKNTILVALALVIILPALLWPRAAVAADLRAPMSPEERKLLMAADARASAETRRKLADLYRSTRGQPAPAKMTELDLARDLLGDVRLGNVFAMALFGDEEDPDGIPAGMPAAAGKAMRLLHERNDMITAELAKKVPAERAAVLGATVGVVSRVHVSNGETRVEVIRRDPPGEGQPLPLPEKKRQKRADRPR